MICNLIGSIGGKVLDIVDDVVNTKTTLGRNWEVTLQHAFRKSHGDEAAYKVDRDPQRSERALSLVIHHGSFVMPSATRPSLDPKLTLVSVNIPKKIIQTT